MERYWITGVQLGMLGADIPAVNKDKIIDDIIDNQFIGHVNDIKKLLLKRGKK